MSIKEQIDSILDARKEKAASLEAKRNLIEKLQTYLGTLDSFRDKAETIEDAKMRKQYREIFREIDVIDTENLTYDIMEKLDAGIKRFTRDYISIATVGRARQGKSTFLQSVGCLGDDIIPAFDTGDCTGATSVIYNTPDMAEGSVSVLLTFKQPQDIVNTVEGYIKEIAPEYFNSHRIEFNKIRSIDLESLRDVIPDGDVNKSTALEHLTKIVKNFNSIRSLFGKAPITLTDPKEIKTYVAQNNGKADDDPDVCHYYNYLAVQRADISCKFYQDCGKIVLVDTIGIGDTQLGIEEAMIKTVDEECDAAIVVTKPVARPRKEDIEVYNMLKDKFMGRNMKQWLFYIANHQKGFNDNGVDVFANEIKNDGGYAVCDCKKINCSDMEDVNVNFMTPLLDSLVQNMESIDGAYLKELNDLSAKIISKCKKLIESLPELENVNPGQAAGQAAYEAGQKAYSKLTAQLKKQVLIFRDEKNMPNNTMWNKVQGILNGIDTLVPEADILQEIIDNNGSMTPNMLWEQACNYVRNDITERFSALENTMERETINFKNSLVRPMYYALKNLFSGEENSQQDDEETDMLMWLKDVMDNIINNEPQYQQIYKAFSNLYSFQFRTRENVIQEIRRQLYSINPITEEYVEPNYHFSQTNTGTEVYYYLTTRLAVIEDELRHSLFNLYRMPNKVFYAEAEEFYDRITFAIDINDTEDHFYDMSKVWGNFFIQYNNSIWAANADKFKKVNDIITQYKGIRSSVLDCLNEFKTS